MNQLYNDIEKEKESIAIISFSIALASSITSLLGGFPISIISLIMSMYLIMNKCKYKKLVIITLIISVITFIISIIINVIDIVPLLKDIYNEYNYLDINDYYNSDTNTYWV